MSRRKEIVKMERISDKIKHFGTWLLICVLLSCCLTSCGDPKLESISISIPSQTLYLDDPVRVTVKGQPADINTKDVTIISSDESIIKITDERIVTGIKEGTTTIYAETPDGKLKSETIQITVKDKAKEQAKQDQQSADKIVAEIDKIGEVTLESKSDIETARKQYDQSSSAIQKLVTNYTVLQAAEAEFKSLQEAENARLEAEKEQARLQAEQEAQRAAAEKAAAEKAASEAAAQAAAAEAQRNQNNGGNQGNQGNNTPNSRTEYITPTGKKYHYNNHCNGGSYRESTLDEALRRGLGPCKKCVG